MVPPTRLLTYPGYGDHDHADDEFDTYGYCQCEEPDFLEDETLILIPDDPAEEREVEKQMLAPASSGASVSSISSVSVASFSAGYKPDDA